MRRHSCPAFEKHRHERCQQDEEQSKQLHKDETLLTAEIEQLMKSQHFTRQSVTSLKNSELNFGKGTLKRINKPRQLSDLQNSSAFLKSNSKLSLSNLPLFSPSKIRLSKNSGVAGTLQRKTKSHQNKFQDQEQRYQTHYGGFMSQVGGGIPMQYDTQQKSLKRRSNQNSIMFDNINRPNNNYENESNLHRADSKYSLYPQSMQNLLQTMRRPSTSQQNSFIFGAGQKRHNQMKSLINISEILSNLNNQNPLKANLSLGRLNQCSNNFQIDHDGLLTGGRQGKLVDLKYSRAISDKQLLQFNNRKDPNNFQKDQKYKANRFNKSELNPQNQIVLNQYGQYKRRSFVHAQDLNSLNSYQTENFQNRVKPKKNKVFPDEQRRKGDRIARKNKKNQENSKIKRQKKFILEQEKKERRNYKDQGTQESNIHTTFENYMNEIEGINNDDLGEPPSFIDMNDAQIRTSKTPFLELSSIDKLVASKDQKKKSKTSQMKSMDKSKLGNKNLSQFSDLNSYVSNDNTQIVPNTSLGLVKASKRYIDDDDERKQDQENNIQQNKQGIRVANQTLYLTNITQNNDILNDTQQIKKKNLLSHQYDTLDQYERTLHQLLGNKRSPQVNKQSPLPRIKNLKLSTIDTDISNNCKNKKLIENAGNISAVSPRDAQNSTRNRIFAKEQHLLSPLNNQYDAHFQTPFKQEEYTRQKEISKIEQVIQTARSSKQQLIIKKPRKESKNRFLSNPISKLQRKLNDAVNMNQQAIAKNLTSSPTSSLSGNR